MMYIIFFNACIGKLESRDTYSFHYTNAGYLTQNLKKWAS